MDRTIEIVSEEITLMFLVYCRKGNVEKNLFFTRCVVCLVNIFEVLNIMR